MKILGLLGGVSWVSTIDYYKYINTLINKKTNGKEYAECIIYSVNYAEIKRRNAAEDFDGTYKIVADACKHLKNSGANGIVLCANTIHMFADELEHKLDLPVISIAIATADAIQKQGLKKVALLGTKFTMEMDFIKDKIKAQNIEVIIPDDEDKVFIHETIAGELGRGEIVPATKQRYLTIIEKMKNEGAEGIILGCTEIPLLIQQADVDIPVFDTTYLHAEAAVNFAMRD